MNSSEGTDYSMSESFRLEEKKPLPNLLKIPSFITIGAAQNSLIARAYLAQQQIMELANLTGTIATPELITALEHLHVFMENFEAHIRQMRGRHSEDI